MGYIFAMRICAAATFLEGSYETSLWPEGRRWENRLGKERVQSDFFFSSFWASLGEVKRNADRRVSYDHCTIDDSNSSVSICSDPSSRSSVSLTFRNR